MQTTAKDDNTENKLKKVSEQIVTETSDDSIDLIIGTRALDEFNKNPITYTMEDVFNS